MKKEIGERETQGYKIKEEETVRWKLVERVLKTGITAEIAVRARYRTKRTKVSLLISLYWKNNAPVGEAPAPVVRGDETTKVRTQQLLGGGRHPSSAAFSPGLALAPEKGADFFLQTKRQAIISTWLGWNTIRISITGEERTRRVERKQVEDRNDATTRNFTRSRVPFERRNRYESKRKEREEQATSSWSAKPPPLNLPAPKPPCP